MSPHKLLVCFFFFFFFFFSKSVPIPVGCLEETGVCLEKIIVCPEYMEFVWRGK